MISGLSHITFIVKGLDKSSKFFKEVFGAKEIYDSKNKNFSLSREKFFLINKIWIAIMEGDSLREKTYNHIAFSVPEKYFVKYENKIKKLGLEIKESRKRVEGEGKSIYFYDYDNHLFEIHTGNLKTRLKKYNK